ncbi:MAG TPA: serine/threonine-protein kinase [Myxococcus sp.]|nr:serine/threonine-protein kinase [Myxococcus sp.]
MSFLLYPARERAVPQDGAPLLWELGPYRVLFQRPEHGTTGALLARRTDADGAEGGEVLIHQLPAGSVAREGASALFHEEWRRVTRLAHPNVLRTLDVWLDVTPGGQEAPGPRPLFFQLVTEYVPGETLSTVLAALEGRGSRMPVPLALEVLTQVAHGLHAAHEAVDAEGRPLGVVHRDVAPAHVVLGYDGAVKLGGFGMGSAAVQLMPGPLFKHVGSQPPEVQRKGGGSGDRRADVYGLGVTLYEALTGVDPFRRAVDFDSLKAAMSADAPPPSHHRPELPAAVDAVVMRAMAPRPEDRYPSAADFARALVELRAAFPLESGREALVGFLRDLFGEERIRARTHLPGMEALLARAAAAAALETFSSREPEAPAPPATGIRRFVPSSRLLILYAGGLMLLLSMVLSSVARKREAFVAEVAEAARGGHARAAACLERGTGAVPVQLSLDGQGRASARVQGPLAGTVAARCIEEALAGVSYPKQRGLPVRVEVAPGGP